MKGERMNIEACEDYCGDPCYITPGHIDPEAFRAELARCEDYGEDPETVQDYHISHCYRVSEPPSSRFPDGGWRCAGADEPDAVAVTLAATWTPKADRQPKPKLNPDHPQKPTQKPTRAELDCMFNHCEVMLEDRGKKGK